MRAGDRVRLTAVEGWSAGRGAGLGVGVYRATARTRTPSLDATFQHVSHAADHSKLWLASAAALALAGGDTGRRAAVNGVASIAVTPAVVNAVLKPLAYRRRPAIAAPSE